MGRGPDRNVTREDVIEQMRSRSDPRCPWTASDLADELPCSSDTVYNRLRELETLGRIRTKKVGARARIWWVPRTDVTPAQPNIAATSAIDSAVMDAMARRDDAAEPWTTSELEAETGHGSDSIYNRLRELQKRGFVDSAKAGSRARVWWPTNPSGESASESEIEVAG